MKAYDQLRRQAAVNRLRELRAELKNSDWNAQEIYQESRRQLETRP